VSGKTTVLLADDHPGILAAVSKYLEKHGLEVLAHARDGHEALEQIREQLPTIALLDIRMPGLDGIEVARLARQAPPASDETEESESVGWASSVIGATMALASVRSVAGGTGKTAVSVPAAAHTTGKRPRSGSMIARIGW